MDQQTKATSMTDHAPLTDEELAAMEKQVHQQQLLGEDSALRLIADLRASRAREKELESMLSKYETFLGGFREY